MKRRYIVTVRLPRNPEHDPQKKRRGLCPLREMGILGLPKVIWITCSDVTGEHHSYIEEAESMAEAEAQAKTKFGHVTRVEGPI